MTRDSAGLTDEVHAELNRIEPGQDHGPQSPSIPARPADGATKEKWAAYVMALGLHPDETDRHTRDELVALADRFGG